MAGRVAEYKLCFAKIREQLEKEPSRATSTEKTAWENIWPAEVYHEELEEERSNRREGGVYNLNNVCLTGKNCVTGESEYCTWWEDEDDDEWVSAEEYGFRRNHILEHGIGDCAALEAAHKNRQDSMRGIMWCEDFMTPSLMALCESDDDNDDVIIEEITRYWKI